MATSLPDPGSPNREFERPASAERLARTVEALGRRGFVAELLENGDAVRRRVLELIPKGAEVHAALSETLREIGLLSAIDESGDYDAVRPKLRALDRETQAREMRKLGAAPDWIVGSAHAVTDGGEVLVASGSGSQLGAYAYAAGHVVLVIGHQKLVSDIGDGLRRIREYCLPREFERMRAAGRPGTLLSETLMLHLDPRHRIHLLFVAETLGF